MSNQGYLRHLIESLAADDANLVAMLSPAQPASLKSLYTYESKMAMLARLATTPTGAELLLESGLLVRLAEMTVFGARPDLTPAMMELGEVRTVFLPPPLCRAVLTLFKLCFGICRA